MHLSFRTFPIRRIVSPLQALDVWGKHTHNFQSLTWIPPSLEHGLALELHTNVNICFPKNRARDSGALIFSNFAIFTTFGVPYTPSRADMEWNLAWTSRRRLQSSLWSTAPRQNFTDTTCRPACPKIDSLSNSNTDVCPVCRSSCTISKTVVSTAKCCRLSSNRQVC